MNGKLLVAVMLLAPALGGQTLTGYSTNASARERGVESDVVNRPSPADADAHSRFLSLQPHMSGTPAQARTRDYVISQMKSWGLETEVRSPRTRRPSHIVRCWRSTAMEQPATSTATSSTSITA